MNLTVKTVYSKERLLRFANFVAFRKLFMWIILAIVTILATIPFVFQFTTIGINGNIILGFCLILLADLFYVFSYFIAPRMTINKSPSLGVAINYTFLDSVFLMDSSSKAGAEKATLNYTSLLKVKESKTDIYLYISRNQAYIVDKSEMTEEQATELFSFLNNKLEAIKAAQKVK